MKNKKFKVNVLQPDGSRVAREVTMREPVVRDVKAVGHITNPSEKEVAIISNLTGLSIDEIDNLTMKDYNPLMLGLQDFFS